jgi:hypothetical protein
MKLTLDVENTVTHRDGKLHLDPFETRQVGKLGYGWLSDRHMEKNIYSEITLMEYKNY